MYQWIALGITLFILVVLIIRKPVLLVPLLGIAVALEISSTWYPDLGYIESLLGIVSLTRFTSIALILAAFGRLPFSSEMRRKISAVLKDPLSIILLIYIVIGGASVIYSADPGKTITETLRILVLFAVFISVALLMDKSHALWPFKAVHFSALALAPLIFYEGFSRNLIWQAESLITDNAIRVNATFVDPNILARYMILGIVANFVLQIYTREKGARLAYMGTLAILLAELALTSSRGGLLTLVAVLIAALIFLPNKKAVLWVLGLGALLGALILFIRPDIWERMLTLTQSLEVSNPQRLYLWKAAIAMFLAHPVLGVGLGAFQTVFLTDYIHLKTASEGVTLSHTTALTVAAELGAIGLTVLALLWIIILFRLYRLHSLGNDYLSMFNNYINDYYVGAGYFLWALTIFISSQGEGRFFEDPILWLSCACLVILRFKREYNLR